MFRRRDPAGRLAGDVIALRDEDEPSPGGEGLSAEPLLRQVMRGGRALGEAPGLDEARELLRRDLAALDDGVKALRDPAAYPVHLSPRLDELRTGMEAALATDPAAAGAATAHVSKGGPCE